MPELTFTLSEAMQRNLQSLVEGNYKDVRTQERTRLEKQHLILVTKEKGKITNVEPTPLGQWFLDNIEISGTIYRTFKGVLGLTIQMLRRAGFTKYEVRVLQGTKGNLKWRDSFTLKSEAVEVYERLVNSLKTLAPYLEVWPESLKIVSRGSIEAEWPQGTWMNFLTASASAQGVELVIKLRYFFEYPLQKSLLDELPIGHFKSPDIWRISNPHPNVVQMVIDYRARLGYEVQLDE